MAEAAEEKPSYAQMIAEMQKAKFVPPQGAQKPPEPSHQQMIEEMQRAGYNPGAQPQPDAPKGLMDRNLNPLSGVPIIGGGDVSANDMIHGAIDELPLVGGVIGSAVGGGIGAAGGLGTGGVASVPLAVAGAAAGGGVGGAAGSALKDTLNNFIYGKQKPLMDAVRDAAASGGVMAAGAGIGEGALAVGGAVGKAALATEAGSKVGALISGVPSSVVKAYADGAQRIKAAFQSSDESTFRMAQVAREQYVKDLANTRSVLGKQVEQGVAGSTETIDAAPIIKQLEDSSAKLNPTLERDTGQIQQIEALIYKVKDLAGPEGKLTLQDAAKLNTHFQDVADAASAYGKPGAASVTNQVGFAAKTSGGVTRNLMNKVAPEAVVKANNQLSTLHKIEDSMNMSLLNPRGKTAALIDAGTDTTGKNFADLQDMQAVTGTGMTGPAQDIAAAKAFGGYKFSPSVKGLGQPAVKAAIDATNAMMRGQTNGIGTTLGQSIMHGTAAQDSLKRVGE